MPSPTWRTVPTSARSVSTEYSSIRCLRIEVISSGRSFKATPSQTVDEVGTRLRRAPEQANVSAVMKAVLGVVALAAAAALAVAASASSGHAKAPQLTGAVKVVFSGQ